MILIKREHKKRIMNTKVIPEEECVHGHHLVVMDKHLKVRKYRKNHQGLHRVQPRIKVWKLKKQEVQQQQQPFILTRLFFPSILGLTSPMAFPQHYPPS